MQVVYKLWESSFDEDAVVRDADAATYVDPAKVHPIEHTGEYFTVPGFHLCEPSPQRTPVLFQAGASSSGIDFGGKHAEAAFIQSDLRGGGQAQRGQDPRRPRPRPAAIPRDIQIVTLITVVVRRHRRGSAGQVPDRPANATHDGCLARFSGWTGIDMSDYDLDTPLADGRDQGQPVHARHVLQGRPGPGLDPAPDRRSSSPSAAPASTIVGSPQTVAAELRRWRDEADIDGINLSYTTKPGGWEEFIDLALPELRAQGIVSPQRAGRPAAGDHAGEALPRPQAHPGLAPRLRLPRAAPRATTS